MQMTSVDIWKYFDRLFWGAAVLSLRTRGVDPRIAKWMLTEMCTPMALKLEGASRDQLITRARGTPQGRAWAPLIARWVICDRLTPLWEEWKLADRDSAMTVEPFGPAPTAMPQQLVGPVFADNIFLFTTSAEMAARRVGKIQQALEADGLKLAPEAEVLTTLAEPPTFWPEWDVKVERNDGALRVLGVWLDTRGGTMGNMRRRCGHAEAASGGDKRSTLRTKGLTRRTRAQLIDKLLFPMASYGAACSRLNPAELRRLDSAQAACFRNTFAPAAGNREGQERWRAIWRAVRCAKEEAETKKWSERALVAKLRFARSAATGARGALAAALLEWRGTAWRQWRRTNGLRAAEGD